MTQIKVGNVEVKPIWKPNSPAQSDFCASTADYVLFGGSRGPGKTSAIMAEATRFGHFPDYKCLLLRRTFPQLTEIIERANKLYKQLGWNYESEARIWRSPAGAFIQFGHCFDPETEILTDHGWEKFYNLRKVRDRHAVASFDTKTNKIFYTCGWEYIEKEYSGEMILCEQKNGVNFMVTPDHDMLVYKKRWKNRKPIWKTEICKAKDLAGFIKIRRSFPSNNAKKTKIKFPSVDHGHKKIIGCDLFNFAKFLGWFLSEGCLAKNAYKVFLYQKDITAIEKDVEDCGFNFYTEKTKNGVGVDRVVIASKELYTWLLENCGKYSYEKRIPKEVLDEWHVQAVHNLLERLIIGDGCEYDTSKTYITTSKGLADDVQEVCINLGYCATITERPEYVRQLRGKKYKCRARYQINITEREYTQLRPHNLQRVQYAGKVYCVNIPPHHTIIVRRNGRVMACMNCQHERDKYNFIGKEFHRILYDQVERFTESQFTEINTTLRTTNPKIPTQVLATANPGGIGHVWCKNKWIDRCPPVPRGERIYSEEAGLDWQPMRSGPAYIDEFGESWEYHPAFVFDNPDIMENDPKYVRKLLSLPHEKREAYLWGNWDIFVGQFFGDFRKDVHVITSRELPKIPKTWDIYGGCDYASSGWYFSLVAAVNHDGEVILIDEDYFLGGSIRKKAKRADKMISKYPTMKKWAAPWDMFNVTRDRETEDKTGKIVDRFKHHMRHKIPIVKAPKDRVDGWDVIKDGLSWTDGDKPWLYFHERCKKLIETIPAQIYSENDPEDLDKDGFDHGVDCLRYILGIIKRQKKEFPVDAYDQPRTRIMSKPKHWLLR